MGCEKFLLKIFLENEADGIQEKKSDWNYYLIKNTRRSC